jgi:hypothetical protein
MIRTACFAVVLAFSSSAAFAQAKAALPGKFQAPAPGMYSGSLKEGTGTRTSDVKLEVKNVTKDGRVGARVTASGTANPACAKSLPASGIMLDDNSMRLEVDAGAPEGCERVYNVKASGSTLSGTFVDARSSQKGGGKK